jgi:methylthioribose-1-phosphate isomerase
MAPLTSIRTSNGKLEIVNQLLLPHTTEFIDIDTIEDAHGAIKTMKVLVQYYTPTAHLIDSW